MLEKPLILLVILILFLVFYLVISLGAGKSKTSHQLIKITNYLFGVRILIIILAVVAVTLWMFL